VGQFVGNNKNTAAKVPFSLRSNIVVDIAGEAAEAATARKATVVGLIAVASIGSAEAQQSLPPVSVEAPVARPKPAASKPSAEQIRARNALRRQAQRQQQAAQSAPVADPNAEAQSADRNPNADAAAPYKIDKLSQSGKFPEPVLNTAKSITVLSKEVLADKNATTLKSAVLGTAGVTLGTGEGGNAFGDRFFIRGFDARNDVFIDGVRDSGVSVRENFFTEQIEILKGPGSSFAGRGTTGGAINIVTKQARTDRSFYNGDASYGTDNTKRITLDVNQVINPTLAIRAGGLFQDGAVAGRNNTTDDRNGAFAAVKWAPVDAAKFSANYIHTDLHGIPDFGVPYFRPSTASTAGGPFPDFGVNRNNFYGFVNRDFFKVKQDIGTINGEFNLTPDVTLTNKFRVQRSSQDYIGTLSEAPVITNPNPLLWTLSANPQSRFQVTDILANQTELTYKFNIANWRNTLLAGVELSREDSSIDKYTGLSSEALPGGFAGTGSLAGVNIFAPQFTYLPFGAKPALAGLPTKINIDTKSGYIIDTANYNDFVILNGGVRYDDYSIGASGFGTVNGVANVFGSQSQHSSMPNFNLGITVKPIPIGAIYAAYATSSNPVGAEFDGTSVQYGGIAPVLNGNPSQLFGPEKNRAAEVGTKWELFDRHMLVTAALFQTEKDNARESQNVTAATATATCPFPNPPVAGSVSCITAGAAYRIRGVDFGVTGNITPQWSVFGGLVLMNSEVTKSLIPPANTTLFTTNVGLPLSNIAHQSFNLMSKYKWGIFEFGATATYRSKIYGGTFLAANQGTSIPDYWKFDLFAEAKITKNWIAKVFVNNLTNKRYYDALYQSAAPFVLEAPGRSATFMISARF
jgi:catecholate siderophore receptor